ncbi:MAG: hypothetical protein A2511_03170 [Deltaproteobacteria bacterium RIFOXYD12_FULL_50_9]|nr:MAG: hypothetical protein A2511_03170 [Deltaproteobacteria bacterium RIFOXYD12_FULL_50_9]
MKAPQLSTAEINQAVDDLFNFAFDREDVKWLMANLVTESEAIRAGIEHELQLLKIISVGWSISYCLADSPIKKPLAEHYWRAVYTFSQTLSQTAGLMIGQDIDYFQTVRKRLDMYVMALNEKTTVKEPAMVIGPEFAKMCKKDDEIFIIMAGSKMFVSTIARVKTFLEPLLLNNGEEPATQRLQ